MNLSAPSVMTGTLTGAGTAVGAAAPGPSTVDARSLAALRRGAARDPKAAIKETAKQFETMFMQQLLKSMRAANETMASGLMDNQATKLGGEMLDTEYASQMSGAPGGLADVIARQLERQMGLADVAPSAVKPFAAPPERFGGLPASTAPTAAPTAAAGAPASSGGSNLTQRQADFVQRHTDAARAAEAHTGIPASFMVAQAAHESGWGRREIKNADGSTSFNVFGIKAGAGWTGAVANATTTEYANGVAHKTTAAFRAYASYEEAFADYARLIKNSPRYGAVVKLASANSAAGNPEAAAAGFAQGLQRAGYATDPAYADKLTRAINTTLRLQRAVQT
jgi:peptidoglycan hydrolase FlgJ